MTSSIGGDVSCFRDVFPELSAMPDAVLAMRLERLREIEEVIRHLNWLDHRDESDGDAFDWLPSDG
jgi:hypothetical protein